MQHITHAMQPNLCSENLGLSYLRVATQPNGDLSGDHNHDQHLVFNGDISGDHNHDQHLVSNTHRDLVSWSYQNIAVTSHDYLIVQVTTFFLSHWFT